MRQLTRILVSAGMLWASSAAQAGTYALVIERQRQEIVPGRVDTVVAVNGSVPGPTLRLREGEDVTVNVTNRLKESASIHWHGLLLDGPADGAPGFNNFPGIAPGKTHSYRFTIRQSGTYWYHAHSSTHEQAGQYAALIIDPAGPDPLAADREHVVLLSDHTRENPERVIRNLKADSAYYNWNRRTLPELFRDIGKFGLGKTLAERKAWGEMRMEATDMSDVSGYELLINGMPTQRKPWLEYRPGERVRLRLINGSAMSFMDVRIPGLAMTVVATDGRPVQPVTVDEFRMGVAETYDVIVEPKDDRAYALWAETIDRKAHVLASLAPRAGMDPPAPASRPKQVLLLSEMGDMGDMGGGEMAADTGKTGMAGMDHAAMGHAGTAGTSEMTGMSKSPPVAATDPNCPPEHAAMGHCKPAVMADMDHAAMGQAGTAGMSGDMSEMAGMSKPSPVAATDPNCPPEHAAMGHCKPAQTEMPMQRVGTAVASTRSADGTPYPVVDYGFGSNAMAAMDHASMGSMGGSGKDGMAGMNMPVLGKEGDTDASGRVFGWATGAPYGARVLSVRDLASAAPHADVRPPTRTIVIRLQGNMERYIWTLNEAKFGEAPPIRVAFNERVRITFINETMMAHPMHLHGMFFEVENGQPADRMPEKTVVVVAPGRTQSIIVTANEAGEWPLHCHLLYHMDQGMMQKFVVATVAAPGRSGEK